MRFLSVRNAWARVAAVLAVVAFTAVSSAFAQGVTSASVRGRILDESGNPIDGAVVTAIATATGQRYQGHTRSGGLFNLENLPVGRYVFEARAIGYRAGRTTPTTLALGQVADLEIRLPQAAVELGAVEVRTEEVNPLITSSRTGAASAISDSVILRLPSLSRNFVDFIGAVPQVVGTSVGGLNNRFNNIQIDGGVNNDLFGLASSGTPGGQANAVPISVEAVREFQVLIAPFDVRQGGFTGGIINAVTRSGTNEFRGTAFGYYQSNSLVSAYKDSTGYEYKPSDFSRYQYGFTFGGPIIRDRLHFFTVVDLSRNSSPFPATGQIIPDTTGGRDSVGIGIRWNTAIQMQDVLKNQYGFDPGGPVGPTQKNPDSNILFKLSGQLGEAHHFDLSYNYVNATLPSLSHQTTNSSYGYQLSNSGYDFLSKTNTLRMNMRSALGSLFTNELIVGYTSVREHREIANRVPLIVVNGDRSGTYIGAGGERYSQANLLNQDIIEVTDNLTFPTGQHLFTLGTHNEFFHFKNVFFPISLGAWYFRSVDSLAAANPYRYQIALPTALRPDGPVADFKVQQYGVYLQDKWTPVQGLNLFLGVRYDVPKLPKPAYNQALDSTFFVLRGGAAADFAPGAAGGINSSTMSMAGLFSPRFGFNYDLTGEGSTVLRGGVGIFTGRPAYVWVSNAYSNTGMEQATLTCSTAATMPTFTVDPDNQPTQCAGGGAATPPIPSIVYYDANFKFPQTLRFALGADKRLPWGLIGTFDFLFTRYVNNYYITDANLKGPQSLAVGEGDRVMYGTISGSGSATAARVSGSFADVLEMRNRSGDRAWSATMQLQKRFSNGMEFSAAYTYGRAMDYITLGSSIANSNFRYTTLDGTIENRYLRRSPFDRPHRIQMAGSFDLPADINVGLNLTVQSGTPYGYVVSNDANADGLQSNDLVYVPLYSTDITLQNAADWTRLNNYINSEPCLNAQRGRIMSRNSCRNPWQTFLSARVSKVFPTVHGQSVELSADIFNLPRLLGSVLDNDWGVVNQTSGFENATLLTLRGWNSAMQRGVYSLSLPVRRQVSIDASRWKMQFGARYSF
jgi:hypothetical protein